MKSSSKSVHRSKYRRAPIALTDHEKVLLVLYGQVSSHVRQAIDTAIWRAFTGHTGEFPIPISGPHIDPHEPFGASLQRVQAGHLGVDEFDRFEPFWRTPPDAEVRS